MRLPRYTGYRDSGVEWLGQVPVHWPIKRVQDVARVINGYPFDSKLFERDGKFPLIRIRDLDASETATRYSGEFVAAAAVTSDDLLIGMDGEFNVGRWCGVEPALLNQRMCCVRTISSELTTFLRHSLPIPLKAINDITYSTTVKHLSSIDVEKIRIALPPADELQAIAAFLEREAAKIDTLIATQEKLITLLVEKRQATISHAVTRGLDPLAPTRESGVAWLGRVPAHWTSPPLYMRYSSELGKMLDTSRITGQNLMRYLRNVDVQWDHISYSELPVMDIAPDEYERYTVVPGDLLVCEGGEVGRAAVVTEAAEITGFQKALHRLRARSNQELPRFMFYTFAWASSAGAFAGEGQSTISHLTGEQLRKYRFPKPPLKEQADIVRFLDSELKKLSDLRDAAEQAVALLKERRAALIAAAVTGQIDVRGTIQDTGA